MKRAASSDLCACTEKSFLVRRAIAAGIPSKSGRFLPKALAMIWSSSGDDISSGDQRSVKLPEEGLWHSQSAIGKRVSYPTPFSYER